jgi:hypothetical protein
MDAAHAPTEQVHHISPIHRIEGMTGLGLRQPRTKLLQPPVSAAAYVGFYRNDLFGPIEIVEIDGGLALRLGPKRNSFALNHFERDVFTYQPTG